MTNKEFKELEEKYLKEQHRRQAISEIKEKIKKNKSVAKVC